MLFEAGAETARMISQPIIASTTAAVTLDATLQ
jgi:hypothetical protein